MPALPVCLPELHHVTAGALVRPDAHWAARRRDADRVSEVGAGDRAGANCSDSAFFPSRWELIAEVAMDHPSVRAALLPAAQEDAP